MNIKMKRLKDNAPVPTRAKAGDAGLDMVAVEEKVDAVTRTFQYKLGWAVEIPEGYVGLLYPRSSIYSTDLIMANGVGVIDSGYRGELIANFKSTVPMGVRKYKVGDKVAQLVIVPIPTVDVVVTDELSPSERGEDGLGSTGR